MKVKNFSKSVDIVFFWDESSTTSDWLITHLFLQHFPLKHLHQLPSGSWCWEWWNMGGHSTTSYLLLTTTLWILKTIPSDIIVLFWTFQNILRLSRHCFTNKLIMKCWVPELNISRLSWISRLNSLLRPTYASSRSDFHTFCWRYIYFDLFM